MEESRTVYPADPLGEGQQAQEYHCIGEDWGCAGMKSGLPHPGAGLLLCGQG
jgi:hypothetical protein